MICDVSLTGRSHFKVHSGWTEYIFWAWEKKSFELMIAFLSPSYHERNVDFKLMVFVRMIRFSFACYSCRIYKILPTTKIYLMLNLLAFSQSKLFFRFWVANTSNYYFLDTILKKSGTLVDDWYSLVIIFMAISRNETKYI